MDFLDLGLLARDPIAFFIKLLMGLVPLIAAMLVGFTIHEFSHALVANRLGDTTSKRLGRLSLNPLVHLDPVGTLMILLAGFGWAKPVPVNPFQLRGGMTRGMAMVSLAGPASNIIVAALAAMVFRFELLSWYPTVASFLPFGQMETGRFLVELVYDIVWINLVLCVFNLLPIAPLDGFKVALAILPKDLSISLAKTEQYGMGILVMLFAFDFMFNVGIFGRILGPIISFLLQLLTGFGW